MKNKILLCALFLTWIFTSCSNDDSSPKTEVNSIENKIKGKWYYYGNEDFDDENNLLNFLDLRQTDCNSGFIIFKDNNLILQEHADIEEDCEKYESDGTWNYNKNNNQLTFIENDEDGDYIIKGTILQSGTNELRIRLIQEGDDTDFEDIDTQLVLKRQL